MRIFTKKQMWPAKRAHQECLLRGPVNRVNQKDLPRGERLPRGPAKMAQSKGSTQKKKHREGTAKRAFQ